jgi:hypothetical protein
MEEEVLQLVVLVAVSGQNVRQRHTLHFAVSNRAEIESISSDWNEMARMVCRICGFGFVRAQNAAAPEARGKGCAAQ